MVDVTKTVLETRTGRAFDFANIKPEMFHISDIAAALSKTCRYNGHGEFFYSVAEHCCRGAEFVHRYTGGDNDAALQFLLHDAAEAYVGDNISPLKVMVPGLKELENEILESLAFKFGIQHPAPDWVKEVDLRILLDEKKALFPGGRLTWLAEKIEGIEPLDVDITGWQPNIAEEAFLQIYTSLTGITTQVATR